MKINKKLPILLGVITLSYISTLGQFKPVQTEAALTAPTSYDYAFRSITSGGNNFFIYEDKINTITSIPLFTRTTDSTYFNYSHDFLDGQHSNTSNFYLPDGLNVQMTFNRSNTSWTDASPYSGYYPTDTKIGSDNSVGSITNKVNLKFDNQTNKNYNIIFDFSSTGNGIFGPLITYNLETSYYLSFIQSTTLYKVLLPAYYNIEVYFSTTAGPRYFDAWYLQDLGVSAAYDAGINDSDAYSIGFAAGFDAITAPNTLLNGFQAMVGILVNFFLMIVNLEVFGVSISSVFAIIVIFVGIIWTLKIIRG
jgi:hypothetical protein